MGNINTVGPNEALVISGLYSYLCRGQAVLYRYDNYIYRAHARSICGRAVIFTVRKIRSCDWLIWHSLRAR